MNFQLQKIWNLTLDEYIGVERVKNLQRMALVRLRTKRVKIKKKAGNAITFHSSYKIRTIFGKISHYNKSCQGIFSFEF
jgi:hypothetical protein